ncbi:CopG family transcriptional regulator [Synechococcus moorigangaii CMS01]|nr:CopG family transcriptional regulator [Synechococcus moorigangaii CMS01]
MSAEELEQRFDNGEEILQYFDLETAQRPGLETEKVSIEFPRWMLNALEKEAQLLGVSSQAIIKFWIAERLNLPKNVA